MKRLKKDLPLEDILREGARRLGAELDERAVEIFLFYLEELKRWNKRINLTSITEDREIITVHFLDSLAPLKRIRERGAKTLLDIGSGAGFPGLPLKIVSPGLDALLLEASSKKVSFMRHIIRTSGLAGIKAIHGRAEDPGLIEEYGGSFDCVISRALASFREFLRLGSPYVRKGGLLMAIKGPSVRDELRDFSGEEIGVTEVEVPFTEKKTLLVEKIAS